MKEFHNALSELGYWAYILALLHAKLFDARSKLVGAHIVVYEKH
jgi:hypothetical protein